MHIVHCTRTLHTIDISLSYTLYNLLNVRFTMYDYDNIMSKVKSVYWPVYILRNVYNANCIMYNARYVHCTINIILYIIFYILYIFYILCVFNT